MGDAASSAGAKGARKAYAQVKVSIDPEVSSAFRTACSKSNVSMAEVLSPFMAKFSKTTLSRKAENATRRQRRASVGAIIRQLEQIKGAEERYRDAIPVNLSGSAVYETADASVSLLEEAIDILGSVY